MTTWFITGIARGLGRALAQAALERGDTVIGTSRSGGIPFADTAGSLHVLDLDLNDAAAIERTVETAFALGGRIDVMVNNAGYGLLGPVEEASDDDLARLFEVNLFAPFRVLRAALPRLRAQGGGHIVNVTSVAGRAPIASTGLYAAAKAGMEALSHSLAQEVAPFGIRVTAVAPGTLRTDFFSDHSIRRTASGKNDVYASTVGKALAAFEAIAGHETGDPALVAAAIIAVVNADDPPGHLLLGSDALRRARDYLDGRRREIDHWEALTLSTDVEQGRADD
jgi:NAD(P)-dependent dehydrogenase (short-subunit alcohol dehydrogenase family)